MSKAYITLTIIAVLVALVLLFLPERINYEETKPEMLIKEINDPARYLSVDQVAERLINEDPSLMLIDVRNADQYNKYSLPGAFNIPLGNLLEPEWIDYLNQDDMDVVLFSNGDVYADQAWILCTRLGYKNLYVIKGGLNKWYSNIISPNKPKETAPSEEFDRYSFRLAASQYFRGDSDVSIQADMSNEKVIIKRKKKKVNTAGGC